MAASPFRITIYDKAFARLGWLPDPISIEVTPRHNQIGTATIVVPTHHTRIPDLAAEGARVVIEYNGEQILSGPVRMYSGTGPDLQGEVTFRVEDDIRLLWRILGWPAPASPASSQPKEDKRTGNAETVLKGFVSANASRLGIPLTTATNLNRGATITVAMRMAVLADKLFPAVETAGLGVSVKQVGSGLTLDVYLPNTYPFTLTERSGVVQSWEWSKSAPTATRTVIGDANTGTSRVFRLRPNFSGSTNALETLWADKVEVFTDESSSTVVAEMDQHGDETLADNATKAGLKVELAETAQFRYGGSGVHVGDMVSLDVAPGSGVTITDLLREATLTWSAQDGLVVKPTAGERADDPDKILIKAITRIQKVVRDLKTR
jgi:hypothetical protein